MSGDVLFKVLRETCTNSQLKHLLQSREVASAGRNWDELIEQSVKPALKSKVLTEQSLLELIQESEEHGNQHVYLYTIAKDKAKDVVSRTRVEKSLKAMNASEVLAKPRLLDKPAKSTLAAVRWESSQSGDALVIKYVQEHKYREFISEKPEGEQFVIRYRLVAERMVDLIKVSESGMVEVRLTRREGQRYEEILKHFWLNLEPLVSQDGMKETSLGITKDYLISNSSELSNLVRYSTSTLSNNGGYKARFAAGSRADDIVTDSGCRKSVDQFLDEAGHCDELSVWFKPCEGSNPLKEEIHVYLKGDLNEVVIPSKCTRAEFGYVVHQLRSLKPKVP